MALKATFTWIILIISMYHKLSYKVSERLFKTTSFQNFNGGFVGCSEFNTAIVFKNACTIMKLNTRKIRNLNVYVAGSKCS